MGFFRIFYISGIKLEYSYTIMYDYEKSPLTHELSYIKQFNFSHLSLFYVNVVKISSKKSLSPFFLFWYLNYEWTLFNPCAILFLSRDCAPSKCIIFLICSLVPCLFVFFFLHQLLGPQNSTQKSNIIFFMWKVNEFFFFFLCCWRLFLRSFFFCEIDSNPIVAFWRAHEFKIGVPFSGIKTR